MCVCVYKVCMLCGRVCVCACVYGVRLGLDVSIFLHLCPFHSLERVSPSTFMWIPDNELRSSGLRGQAADAFTHELSC